MAERQIVNQGEHDFTLALTGINEITQEIEDALFEAGCDDATLSLRSGRVFITFSRTASSLKDAILSAITDIRKANIGADVLRIDVCNLVNQSDIARKIGKSRQLVHQYINGDRGPGGFPSPAGYITDDQPLWFWCEVSYWLWQNNMISEAIYTEVQHVCLINDVLGVWHQRQHEPEITDQVIKSVLAEDFSELCETCHADN